MRQGFGAKTYRILGIYLQSSCIISCSFAIVISVLWFYTEHILILLQQEAEISRTAALYIKCSVYWMVTCLWTQTMHHRDMTLATTVAGYVQTNNSITVDP
ncbi:hypothetical protein HRI_002387400 [Hibiscus trionum]|uniref:Uncharacterized protein n=1 Tax=Hibiscus trionum TaxID=183268 RepID=A0A9W7I1E5_HIBTR|nr:hypothetical protein HRI_002387400 [Hibiscus trionum]